VEVVTNDAIAEGFTALDYGDKRLERMVSLLDQPVRAAYTEGLTNSAANYWAHDADVVDLIGATTNGESSWSIAKAAAESTFGPVTNGSTDAFNIYSRGLVSGEAFSAETRSTVRRALALIEQDHCFDTVQDYWHSPDARPWYLYAIATPPDVGAGYGDFEGFGIFATNDVYLAILSDAGATGYGLPIISATLGSPSLPTPWTDDPDGTPELETARGFLCTLSAARFVMHPRWLFGAHIDLPAMDPFSTTTTTTTTSTTSTTTMTTTAPAPPP
jgi:hypothetical protein